jgi:hypothetical protein
MSNRSFDAEAQRQGAARRAGERAARGALRLRAGHLRLQGLPILSSK